MFSCAAPSPLKNQGAALPQETPPPEGRTQIPNIPPSERVDPPGLMLVPLPAVPAVAARSLGSVPPHPDPSDASAKKVSPTLARIVKEQRQVQNGGVIGEGFQVRVFSHGDYVEKVPKHWAEIALRTALRKPALLLAPWTVVERAKKWTNDLEDACTKIQASGMPPEYFAHPRLRSNGIVEQDLVTPLGHSRTDASFLVAGVIHHIATCWRHGLADRSFNILYNYGLSRDHRVVLLDFGELATDIAGAQILIQDRKWERSRCLAKMSEEGRIAYLSAMNTFMTMDNLSEHWMAAREPRRNTA